ncbi:MAG TPA: L-histidine N(alpha)-methyltransferase [Caldithrix abyssi]|uniref:4-dimethylallyltryptophan N-methyltransferase n=1 Tax=Caldithrix abyssi TaxID=187145 RepID=A0A7V4UF19_CALAY|nr:L-histidine N(alpha)-methyltransferase [Caldithrix abyssi]
MSTNLSIADTAILERFEEILLARPVHKNAFITDVQNGLSASPKTLPCIYFYDERGSQLFEDICRLPEYYLTRCEAEILRQHSREIAASFPADTLLVELGSGSSVKTRYLLEAFMERHGQALYNPIDISHSILRQSALELLAHYPELKITAVAATYQEGLRRITDIPARTRLIMWLGSSIGNLGRQEAVEFLGQLRGIMKPQDHLLIGIDLKKDINILKPAYDDAQGVTAAFNLNVLERMNRELVADFDLNAFAHLCRYNEEQGRIEMHILSLKDQIVRFRQPAFRVAFDQGETIHTENSHKYAPAQIQTLARRSGLRIVKQWFDSRKWFSLNLLAASE